MPASRDMTEKQFIAAMKRNGFRYSFGGLWAEDTTGQAPDVHFGLVFTVRPFRMHRRASLARLLKDRAEHVRKQKRRDAATRAAADQPAA